jgi:sec-independent protein translocase protein TatC
MSTAGRMQSDDDPFAETRMSFGDHIEELRTHLLRAIYGFVIAFAVACFLGQPVVEYITHPVEVALKKYWTIYYQRKEAQLRQESLAGKFDRLPPIITTIEMPRNFLAGEQGGKKDAERPFDILPGVEELFDRFEIPGLIDRKNRPNSGWVSVPVKIRNPVEFISKSKIYETMYVAPQTLKTLSAPEAFIVYFKVSAFVGLVLGAPWVLWQLWSFVAVGLYPHEKKYVYSYFPISAGLFVAGVVAAEIFVIPQAIDALLWFNNYMNIQPDFRLNEWLTFALLIPLIFGLSFQTPLVMLFLNRIGLVSVQAFRKARRYAIFFMAIFATIILPTPDVWTMLMLTTAMCLFYEAGIWMCLWSPAKQGFETGTEETNELVEV